MSGVPLPTVQKQVGHKRLSTTTIYATVAPALVKEAYNMQGSGR
jgi:site-specific recombinase XerD